MNTKNKFIIAILLFCFVSCAEEELITYGDVNYIYFEKEAKDDETYPSTTFSFVFENDTVTQKNYKVPVKVSGKMPGQDRIFKLCIVDTLTTATESTHFIIDEASQVIPRDSTGGNAIIKLLKTADMKDTVYQIGVKIVDNETFIAKINTVIIIKVTSYFAKPDWWYDSPWLPHIGPFTEVKAGLFLQFMGVTDGSDPWDNDTYTNYSDVIGAYPKRAEREASVIAFRAWLETSEGAPYYDENDELVLNTFNY